MKRFVSRFTLLAAVSLLLPLAAGAQSFRTYLASYGNDANAGCTVSAPCRLLPAALNAVLDGGEVWILDSANYNSGTVNITKSVSILAVPGQIASVVAVANSPAINIDTAGVRVTLRNIVIPKNANNPGTYGITMSNGALLSVEDCLFSKLAYTGIYVHDVIAKVQVKNTVFRDIDDAAVNAVNGPTVVVANSQLFATGGVIAAGTGAGSRTDVSVSDSIFSNGVVGVLAVTDNSGGAARMYVTRSTFHGNTISLAVQSGAGPGTAVLYASGNMVDSSGTGWYVAGVGASLITYGNNQFSGNFGTQGSMTLNALQ